MLLNFAVKIQLEVYARAFDKKIKNWDCFFLVEMTCFLRNHSLEFREILRNSSSLNA